MFSIAVCVCVYLTDMMRWKLLILQVSACLKNMHSHSYFMYTHNPTPSSLHNLHTEVNNFD